MRKENLLKKCVIKICVNPICVNKGVSVLFLAFICCIDHVKLPKTSSPQRDMSVLIQLLSLCKPEPWLLVWLEFIWVSLYKKWSLSIKNWLVLSNQSKAEKFHQNAPLCTGLKTSLSSQLLAGFSLKRILWL